MNPGDPAGPAPRRYDGAALAREAEVAVGHVRRTQAGDASVRGWVTVTLGNRSGDPADMRLEQHADPYTPTALSETMPYTAGVIAGLQGEGFRFQYARVAVIEGRSLLRCHVDMYRSARLILPLTAQGSDFRHVFGSHCFAMSVGELWAIDGDTCHGAANVAGTGLRVALLIDAHADGDLPAWWRAPWAIPAASRVERPAWTDVDRRARRERATRHAVAGDADAAEREWLFVPFEYDVTPSDGYAELVRFCGELAGQGTAPGAAFWRGRAVYWAERDCRCA